MTDQWRRNQIEMGGGGALGLSKILTSEKKFIILVMSNFAKKGLPPPLQVPTPMQIGKYLIYDLYIVALVK